MKIIKKVIIISFMLMTFIFCRFFTVTKAMTSGYWSDDGNYDATLYASEVGNWEISDEADLAAFMKKSNDGESFAGCSITLKNNLYMDSHEWTSISLFSGNFDGKGHTIRGITITGSPTETGFFGKIDGATIKNLIVDGSISVVSPYAGGIAGYSTGASVITDCLNKVDVTAYATDGVITKVVTGGIVGYVDGDIDIKDCGNEGSISASESIDNGAWNILSTYSGGIVGQSGTGTTSIINCYSSNAVMASTTLPSGSLQDDCAQSYSGGIIGAASDTLIVNNCYAIGTTAANSYKGTDYFTDYMYGAAIIGFTSTTANVDLQYCYWNIHHCSNVYMKNTTYATCDAFTGYDSTITGIISGTLLENLNYFVYQYPTNYSTWCSEQYSNNGYPIFSGIGYVSTYLDGEYYENYNEYYLSTSSSTNDKAITGYNVNGNYLYQFDMSKTTTYYVWVVINDVNIYTGKTLSSDEYLDVNYYTQSVTCNNTEFGTAYVSNVSFDEATSSTDAVGLEGTTIYFKATPNTNYGFVSFVDSTNLDVALSTNSEYSYKVNGMKNLQANFEILTYTIEYDTNGGTINEEYSSSYNYGEELTLPTDVTKTNYVFVGWYDNSSFTGNIVTSISETDSGNKKYYAKWQLPPISFTQQPVDINKTYNGNVSTLSVEANYGQTLTTNSSKIVSTMGLTGDPGITITYQWYKNETLIEGATSKTYSISNVSDSGDYYCLVKISDGSLNREASSDTVTVTISPLQKAVVWETTVDEFIFDGETNYYDYIKAYYTDVSSKKVYLEVSMEYAEVMIDIGDYNVSVETSDTNYTLTNKTKVYNVYQRTVHSNYDENNPNSVKGSIILYDGEGEEVRLEFPISANIIKTEATVDNDELSDSPSIANKIGENYKTYCLQSYDISLLNDDLIILPLEEIGASSAKVTIKITSNLSVYQKFLVVYKGEEIEIYDVNRTDEEGNVSATGDYLTFIVPHFSTFNLLNVKKNISVPTVEVTSFVYDGTEKKLQIALNNDYSISDDKATVAGDYTAVISLKDKNNTEWNTGDTSDKTIEWTINPKIINRPMVEVTSFVYDGTEKKLQIALNNDYSISGDKATVAGDYTAVISLKDKNNTEWNTGDTSDKTIEWTINPKIINKPTVEVTSFVYNSLTQSLALETSEYYSISNNSGLDAATITTTISLKDKNNYIWDSEDSNDFDIEWEITKAKAQIITNSKSSKYGEDLLELTYTSTGFFDRDNVGIELEKVEGLEVGSYIINAIVSHPNYDIEIINGTYQIEKATYDMSGITFESALKEYKTTPVELVISGTLPEGVEVEYWYSDAIFAGASEIGIYEIEAIFTGDSKNYLDIPSMKATLTVKMINPKKVIMPSTDEITVTATSISFTGTSGQEYSLDNISWSTSTSFTKLTFDTSYTIYSRTIETDEYFPSEVSSILVVTLDANEYLEELKDRTSEDGPIDKFLNEMLEKLGDDVTPEEVQKMAEYVQTVVNTASKTEEVKNIDTSSDDLKDAVNDFVDLQLESILRMAIDQNLSSEKVVELLEHVEKCTVKTMEIETVREIDGSPSTSDKISSYIDDRIIDILKKSPDVGVEEIGEMVEFVVNVVQTTTELDTLKTNLADSTPEVSSALAGKDYVGNYINDKMNELMSYDYDLTEEDFGKFVGFVDNVSEGIGKVVGYVHECDGASFVEFVGIKVTEVSVVTYRDYDEEAMDAEFFAAAEEAIFLHVQQQCLNMLDEAYQEMMDSKEYSKKEKEKITEVYQEEYAKIANTEQFKIIYEEMVAQVKLNGSDEYTVEEISRALTNDTDEVLETKNLTNYTKMEKVLLIVSAFVLGGLLISYVGISHLNRRKDGKYGK